VLRIGIAKGSILTIPNGGQVHPNSTVGAKAE